MIRAESASAKYLTTFTNGVHAVYADTTPDKGGGDQGFRPHELLEAALATCMNMSLRMAAEKQGISVDGVAVTVSLNRSAADGPTFEYRVELPESLTETERTRLLAGLAGCPVRNTLSKGLHFKPVE